MSEKLFNALRKSTYNDRVLFRDGAVGLLGAQWTIAKDSGLRERSVYREGMIRDFNAYLLGEKRRKGVFDSKRGKSTDIRQSR